MRLLFAALVALSGGVAGKVFEKCELAGLLATKHQMTLDDVKSWVCIAEFESTFNTEAVNKANWDGSYDYGLFQLNDKYWCDGHRGKNVCKMPCSDLLDADLTDDLRCIARIIRDTERWKGQGTGLTAWVAYVNRCQSRNLDDYISECKEGIHDIQPDALQPIDNFIPRVEADLTTSTAKPSTAYPPSVSTSNPANSDGDGLTEKPMVVTVDVVRIPSARVPYPSHHSLVPLPEVSRRGATAIHVRSSGVPMFWRLAPKKQSSIIGHSQHRQQNKAQVSVLGPMAVQPLFRFPSVSVVSPLNSVRVGSSNDGPSLTVYRKNHA